MRNLRDIIARRQRPTDGPEGADLSEMPFGDPDQSQPSAQDAPPDPAWFDMEDDSSAWSESATLPLPPNAAPDQSQSQAAAQPTHFGMAPPRDSIARLRTALSDGGLIDAPHGRVSSSGTAASFEDATEIEIEADRVKALLKGTTRPVSKEPIAPQAPEPAVDLSALTKRAASDTNVHAFEAPAPTPGRAGPSAGRAKTRLLGFEAGKATDHNPIEAAAPAQPNAAVTFPVGWLVVTKGPGKGASFALANGVSQLGRSEDQAVPLAFGDTSISRNNHAAVAYDDEERKFFLGHGGKSNLVRLNDRPVLSTEPLTHGDRIRIGETTLLFVALCGEAFAWDRADGDENEDSPAL